VARLTRRRPGRQRRKINEVLTDKNPITRKITLDLASAWAHSLCVDGRTAPAAPAHIASGNILRVAGPACTRCNLPCCNLVLDVYLSIKELPYVQHHRDRASGRCRSRPYSCRLGVPPAAGGGLRLVRPAWYARSAAFFPIIALVARRRHRRGRFCLQDQRPCSQPHRPAFGFIA